MKQRAFYLLKNVNFHWGRNRHLKTLTQGNEYLTCAWHTSRFWNGCNWGQGGLQYSVIRIPQNDVSQENYAPIYFKKNRNRSMYVPFFLAPWLLGSLQLRRNRFSVRWERTGFLYSLAWGLLLLIRRKRDKKKRVQLKIYKQINTWELLFDLLLAVVYIFLFKMRSLLH